MRKIRCNYAFTLIELIVSMTLMGIVVAGLLSINVVLTSNSKEYSTKAMLEANTQAVLNHILHNANLAVGSGSKIQLTDGTIIDDKGIMMGAEIGDAQSICIHQDPNNTPNDTSDDIWYCYTDQGHSSDYQLKYCTRPYTLDPPYRGASSCGGSGTVVGTLGAVTFLTYDKTSGFKITVGNCIDNHADSCTTTESLRDPANNPEVLLTGSVFPPQQAWQKD